MNKGHWVLVSTMAVKLPNPETLHGINIVQQHIPHNIFINRK